MPFIDSLGNKILVGAGTALWLVAFLVFIAPFDASDLSFVIRIQIMVVYGLIFFLCYGLLIWIEKVFYSRFQIWSEWTEAGAYLFLYLLVFPPTVAYYKSEIVNGDYPVFLFFAYQYIPILIIVTPVLYLLRRLVAMSSKEDVILIKGENRQDILRLSRKELVSVSSSDNYIEVSFLNNATLEKRLFRTTLKKVESDFPFLKRVHRSHLINPEHFKEWKDKNTIIVGSVSVPITKQYHENIPSSFRH